MSRGGPSMSGISRDTSGDVAARISEGAADFWAGTSFYECACCDWQAGWLAAASDARRRAEAAAPLLDERIGIVDTLTDAYAALRRASDVPRLTPGARSLITRTLDRLDTLLARLSSAKSDPGPQRETTAA